MTRTDFAHMYRSHYADLLGYCLSLTKSPADAKDLMQESAIKAYIRRESILEPSKFKAWYRSLSFNLFLSQYRKKLHRRELFGDGSRWYQLDQKEIQLNQAESKLAIQHIIDCMSAISNKLSRSLEQFIKGYSYQEIADQENIPVGTVRSRINACRQKLKSILRKSSQK